jgi:hypothetical protein
VSYASFADLIAYGAPRGSTPNPGRAADSVANNQVVLDQHGFETGDEILFTPAGDGAMPTGLSAGVSYYAERVTEHTFKVRATAGGASLTFTDAEDPLVVVAPLNRAAAIEWADRLIDDMVPGQATPFDDTDLYPDGVPAIVKMTSAELAAAKLLSLVGSASRSLADVTDAAHKRLERWSKGIPVRGTPDASRANQAASAPAATSALLATTGSDPRGWRRYGGL